MKNKSDMELGLNGMYWMGIMTFANYFIQLVVTYFLARLLSPTDYGEVAAITILVGFAELFWMMGVGPGIVQKKNLSSEDITTGHTLNIIFGIVIFIIVNVFIESWLHIFSISNAKMLSIFSFVFLLSSMSGVSQSLLQKKLKFRLLSLINSLTLLFYGASALIFAFHDFGPWSLVYSKLIQTTVMLLLLLLFEPVGFKLRVYLKSAKELLYFGGGFTIARIFNYTANNGDNYVVNKTMMKFELGAYSRAYQLLMYPVTLIGTTLDQVLFPLLSKSQDDHNKLKRVFVNGTGLIALLSVPISIIFYICADSLVYLFLGDQWGSTILTFKIMIAGLFFRIGYKLSDSLIRALGRVYQRAVIQIVYAVLVVTGAYIGHYYGLNGVAIGVTVSFIVNYILMTLLSMYYIRFKVSGLAVSIFPSMIYGALTIVAVLCLNSLWIHVSNYFLNCIFVTTVVFGVYGILFFSTRKRLLSIELNNMVDGILKQMKSKIKVKLLRQVRIKYRGEF